MRRYRVVTTYQEYPGWSYRGVLWSRWFLTHRGAHRWYRWTKKMMSSSCWHHYVEEKR